MVSHNSITGFLQVLADRYTFNMDAIIGFDLILKTINKVQTDASKKLNLSIDELDKKPFLYGKGNPNKEKSRILIQTTQKEVKARNMKGGINQQKATDSLIISLYSYWEEEYREKIALEIGLKSKSELKLEVFGLIRDLRNSILHHKGFPNDKLLSNNYNFLGKFERDKKIVLDGPKVILLIDKILEEIAKIK
jgi:hypothetical protein